MLSVLASKENTENVKATTLKVCMEDFPKPMSKICTAKRDEYHSAASVLCSPPQRTPKTFKVAWNISESLLIHNPRSHNQCLRLAQRNMMNLIVLVLWAYLVFVFTAEENTENIKRDYCKLAWKVTENMLIHSRTCNGQHLVSVQRRMSTCSKECRNEE